MVVKNVLRKNEDNPEQKLRKRIKELEKQNEQLVIQLKNTRASKFKLSLGKKKTSKSSQFCRVIIPDSHGSSIDSKAISAFFHDLEVINPSEVVMLGDHLECGGFLAQHHTLGYIAQSKYTFADDVVACNQFLDKIQEIVGKCDIHYIEGNHERRIENWITTQTLKNPDDAEYLHSMFSVNIVLHLQKRGIRLIEQGKFYDKLKLPSTIKLGNCYFTHGISTAKHAASVHVQKFGGNIVYGHTHIPLQVALRTAIGPNDQKEEVYLNTGTWRPRYQMNKEGFGFIGWKNLSYVIFYRKDERAMLYPTFETWNGTLKTI